MLFFIFVPLVSQNLNNDLWSKLQGYAANQVTHVNVWRLLFLKMGGKNQSCETNTSVWKMKVPTWEEVPSQRVIFLYLWKEPPAPRCGLLPTPAPAPLPCGGPQTLVVLGVPTTQTPSAGQQQRVNAPPELWKKPDFVSEVWQCEKPCNQFHFLINEWPTGESRPGGFRAAESSNLTERLLEGAGLSAAYHRGASRPHARGAAARLTHSALQRRQRAPGHGVP